MGLEGEEVYSGWAYADGDNFYSESWSIDMPPSDAFVKTSLCDVVGLRKDAKVEIGILNIRYLLPDDSSGRANLDGIDWPNTIKAWSSPKMTHFTFAIKARQCYALMCCTVGYRRSIPEVQLYQENSFSQKGKVPKTKSIRSVALFDANDGTILHMHHVMTMEGCKPRDMEEIEKDAVRFALFIEAK